MRVQALPLSIALGLLLVAVLAVGVITTQNVLKAGDLSLTCAGGEGVAGSVDTTDARIAGYSGEQLTNAAHIIDAGIAMGLPRDAQEIAVMTAMGESALQILDYGDTAGPDSRGLFQQRGSGAWGSYEDRMDPVISATNFYRALTNNVPEWPSLAPSDAAHRVQRNADPRHYERWESAADEVVLTLTAQAQTCTSTEG
ncbi:hypothetical protein ACFSBZ_15385 [Amnibacterium flavum]|uniref:Peptidase M23 n=1 Tax=Amnibacterium flavum TaxID=2173173 RepID=A0A2V1HU49_9MICO|nr:hypothetical protein [Amnibacterium flavum]PVZ96098.1 hypothetical protein DDQ50_06575 [Amnibacterium flavum]